MAHTILDVEKLKRAAKAYRKDKGCTHTEALNAMAAKHDYASWAKLMREQNKFQRDSEARPKDAQPERDDAYLSAYEQPTYLKTIFRG